MSLKHWLLLLLIAVAPLLGAELLVRTVLEPRFYEYDKTLGWKSRPNLTATVNREDINGVEYEVSYSTDEHGFRYTGKPQGKKILVVGDSFTADPNMSDEDSYFGLISKSLPVEVFAIGAGGYGTLQELLLVEQYADLVEPDIFILQFCVNDFSNNSFSLEDNFIARAQKNLRPYLVDGKIVYRSSKLYAIARRYSRLFGILDDRLQRLEYRIYGGYRRGDNSMQEEKGAIKTTGYLLKKIASAVPNAQKITFTCRTNHELTDTWISIASNAGFDVYPEISRAVERAEIQGEIVRTSDGDHWSPNGHRIAGEKLVEILLTYL